MQDYSKEDCIIGEMTRSHGIILGRGPQGRHKPTYTVASNLRRCPAPQAKGCGVGWHLPGGRGAKSGLQLNPPLSGDTFSNLPKPSRASIRMARECVPSHLRLSSRCTLGSSLVHVLKCVPCENLKHTQMLRES